MFCIKRINAIRRMLNVSGGTPPVKLSTGEKIEAWTLFDERGNRIDLHDIPEDILETCYEEIQKMRRKTI